MHTQLALALSVHHVNVDTDDHINHNTQQATVLYKIRNMYQYSYKTSASDLGRNAHCLYNSDHD